MSFVSPFLQVHKKKPLTVLDCKTFDSLYEYFKKKNTGLIAYINDAPNKPTDEPPFEDFVVNREVCTTKENENKEGA